jgi:serine/threonine-protein kinase
MLVGEPPFTGASVQAIVAKVMGAEPQAPTLIRKTIPAHVERAVLRALAKLPADRFASAAEFSAALGATGAAPADSAGARSLRRSWVARTPVILGVAAAALAVGWLLGRGQSHSTDAGGVIDVSVSLPDSVTIEPLAPVPEGEVAIALSPDASMLVVVGRTASGARLFMRRLGDDQLRPLAGTERGYAPFFSPRGDQIGFFADGSLKRYSVSEQRTTTVASTGGRTWGGAWVADDRLLVSVDRATSLLMMTANGDSIREIPCGGICGNPEALPDSRHVLVSTGTHLAVVDLQRGSIEPLSGPSGEAEGSGPAGMRGTLPRYDGDGHLVWVDTDGHLLAAPFDPVRCEFTGAPVPIGSDVRVESGRGSAQFALSKTGVLAYANGPLMSVGTIVRADRAGKVTPLPIGAENYTSLELAHDGRRLLASVSLPTGERSFHIIDIASGHDAPWVTGRDLMDRPRWWPGEHKVTFRRGSKYFLLDPELAAPPEELTVSAPGGLYVLSDSERYLSYAHDTAVVARFDGKGQPVRVPAPGAGWPALSPDGRWLVNEEQVGSGSDLVVHALDGSQRRVVLGSSSRFSMPYWEVGSTELILAAQKANDGGQADAEMTQQEFWAVSYTPSAAQPFGEPRLLFRASVADFPGRNYSVGGGGSVFVFKQHVAARPLREVRLLVNWHQRLERPRNQGATP